MDIITEISGIDSKSRRSAKKAAVEIIRQGSFLYDMIFDKAIGTSGVTAERCAESCARAAVLQPGLTKNKSKPLVRAILANPKGNMRYSLSAILIHTKVSKNDAEKCSAVIKKWLDEEEGRGARACFLETIYALSYASKKIKPLAEELVSEALKSPITSYSARARQIVMRTAKETSKSKSNN